MTTDLNDILVFVKVIQEESFTRASVALNLPRSSVSRKVARLEDELGARLLQRTTRKLSLTEAGRLYYERCVRAVMDLKEAEQAVLDQQATPRGRVRVTAPVELGTGHILTPLILEFLETYPEVQIDLDLTNRYVDLIAEGYDLAIRAGVLSDSALIAKHLISTTWVLVASPEYLEERGTPLVPGDLTAHDCVIFGAQNVDTTWTLEGPNGATTVRVRGRLTVNDLSVVTAAAAAGVGIARVPSPFHQQELRRGRLVQVLPEYTPGAGSLYAVYPSARHLSPKVRVFVDFLVLRLRELLHPDEGRAS